MEVKIDKRTKEYKENMKAHDDLNRINDDLNRINGVEPASPPTEPYPEPVVPDTTTAGVEQSDPPEIKDEQSEVEKAIKLLESHGVVVLTPGKSGVDLLHCPGCGVELLEDERNMKNRAFCSECVHADENKIVCEDGVKRDKDACKRMTRMVGKDEVFYWVKK